MLKKRLVGTVVVKDDWAVQSFGFNRYLPLGKPECLVENLDRWGADEILVQVIDRSRKKLGPDFDLLNRLANLRLKTPLIYAGGIDSYERGVKVIQLGADRIVVDSLIHSDIEVVKKISLSLGSQAVIASAPVSWKDGKVSFYDYKMQRELEGQEKFHQHLGSGIFSEVLLQDWKNEGTAGAFDLRLVENFPHQHIQSIAFGGISETEKMKKLISFNSVSAIAVGNFLNYREHAVQKYKEALMSPHLRFANYEHRNMLLKHE